MGDLFNPEWVSGDMTVSVVDFVAKYVGMFAVIVISIVGFGIVMASILKNATHGLYAVAPKFWDRVDEVKKVGLRGLNSEGSQKVAPGNNEVMRLIGTGMAVLLSILPNIKAMTDFDDEVLDAKAYFMKAIPLMCLHIFIGVFIFFGYPAKVAQKASEFGTGVFDVVLTNVDPKAWVEDLPEKFVKPPFATDDAVGAEDKVINVVAKKVWHTYVGAAPDITKEKRIEVALAIEDWVTSNMSEVSSFCDSDKYDMKVTSTVYKFGNDPKDSVAKVYNQTGGGVTTFAWYTSFDEFDSGTAIDVSDWFIRYDLVFTTVATTGKSSSSASAVMKAAVTNKADGSGATINLGKSGYVTVGTSSQGTAILRNTGERIDIKIEDGNDGTLIVTPISGKSAFKENGIDYITSISRLTYNVSGFKAVIKEIRPDSSAKEAVFEDSSTGKSWTIGNKPVTEDDGGGQ